MQLGVAGGICARETACGLAQHLPLLPLEHLATRLTMLTLCFRFFCCAYHYLRRNLASHTTATCLNPTYLQCLHFVEACYSFMRAGKCHYSYSSWRLPIPDHADLLNALSRCVKTPCITLLLIVMCL